MGDQEPLAIPYLAMSTGRHSFKHNDAARLIRAVEAAGKKITAVTLRNGEVTVLVDGDSSSAPKRDDEVETWIERQHANQG